MLKVGQLIGNPGGVGGAETMAVYLTQGLQRKGITSEIYVLGTDTWMHDQGRKFNFEVITLPKYVQRHWSIKQLPLLTATLGHFLRTRNIDALHSHMYAATLRGAVASVYAKIPHVATQHDNYSIEQKTQSRVRWLNLAGVLGTRIAMISNQMMNYYIERGIKPKYCCFIYNGVDKGRFESNKLAAVTIRRQMNISNDEFMFVAPARLRSIKGFDVLINAFALLRNLPFRLTILGDGPERSNLENMVKEASLQHKIHFLGAVDNIEDYLSAADAFTLASRNEGLPCSIIEAMFAMLPIITTNVGGNAELVLHGRNGYLVESEDCQSLAETLKRAIDGGKGLLRPMGGVSYQHAQNFTIEEMTKRYISLYNGVCLG